MKKNYVFTVISIFAIIVFLHSNVPAAPLERVVIYNVTLISPEHAQPIKNSYVIMEKGKITQVGIGKSEQMEKESGSIDGSGRFLMPSLIDAHVHLLGIPGFGFQHYDQMPDIVNAYREQLPKSYLYFGFTTLVDLNVVSRKVIDQIKASPVHPDIYDCGGALTMANGYPMVYVPKADRFNWFPNFIYDFRQVDKTPKKYKPDNHSPVAIIKRVKESGAHCVKVFYETGFGAYRNLPVITLAQATKIITESHQYELPVLMHANSYKAHKFAVTAGVDVVAHGMWNWQGINREEGFPQPIRQVLNDLIAKDIGYMPTMRVIGGLQSLFDPEFLNTQQLQHVLPAALIDWYKTEEGRWFAEELKREEGMQEHADSTIHRMFDVPLKNGNEVAQYLAQHRGKLLFGSDTPSAPTYGNPPGLNGYLEIKHLAAAGVPLKQILEAATINNAKAFHLEQQYGTIEPGKTANLLLLTKNPLETVKAYDSIEAIFLHGQYLKRETLSALH